MQTTYSQRLSLLHAICLTEIRNAGDANPSANLQDYDPLEAATYLACVITFKSIQESGRSPLDERNENFDMLSVYQAFALLVYAYLVLPLGNEGIAPDFENAPITIARSLFAELSHEELVEIIESGQRKFELIGNAEQEHLTNYREDLDKAVVAYVIAGTDEEAPYGKDDVIPLFGQLLSMLCEAFASE